MLCSLPHHTRFAALAITLAIAAVCGGVLAQPAMALAAHECGGAACDDQIACGLPMHPQATSGSLATGSLVAIAPTVVPDPIDVAGRITRAPPPVARPESRPVSPSAPRSPPSA